MLKSFSAESVNAVIALVDQAVKVERAAETVNGILSLCTFDIAANDSGLSQNVADVISEITETMKGSIIGKLEQACI